MPVFEAGEKKYDVDEDGFLQEPDRWSDDVAIDFAKSESIDELTDGHWKVIITFATTIFSLALHRWCARFARKPATS